MGKYIELEMKKNQLDSSIKNLQVNFDARRKTFIECGLYIMEAIRHYAAAANAFD